MRVARGTWVRLRQPRSQLCAPDRLLGMQPERRTFDPRQPRALAALVVTLTALLMLWGVGAFLLLTRTPDFGDLPRSSPSPTE